MYASNGNAQRARWAVMWVYVSKRGSRKLFRKDFRDDYASAEELYLRARQANKPYATLACVNMGFPPPEPLRPRLVRKRGRIAGTNKKKIVTVMFDPLREKNLTGELWCPYCRQLRTFIMKKNVQIDNIRFREPRYVCPICKISHRDFNVRHWNPTAAIHMDSSIASIGRARAPRRRRVSA